MAATYHCLNPHHHCGRHKARVFATALGLTQSDAHILRKALLRAARETDVVAGDSDQYGDRFLLDFELAHGGRHAIIRSAWIVLRGENTPRLTS